MTALSFDPSLLAKYGRLTMVARTVVEGFLSGVHKSPYKGFSVEFAEHRQYYPGDEIRHIDWRVLGKTDRYYIKEYEEETNLKAYLLVDAKGKAFQVVGTSTQGVNGAFQYTLTFRAAKGQGEPARLVYTGRRKATLDFPFTLKDVKLP